MATSFHNKLRKVQSSCLDLADVLTPAVVVLINALADAIGCSCEFIFSIVVVSHIQFPILAFSEASEQLFLFWPLLADTMNHIIAGSLHVSFMRMVPLMPTQDAMMVRSGNKTPLKKNKVHHHSSALTTSVLKNCTMSCAETMDNFWASLMRCRPSIHSLIYSSTLGQ